MQMYEDELVKYYKSKPDYDKLFRYFFTVCALGFTPGVATNEFEIAVKKTPSLSIDENGVVQRFLKKGLLMLQNTYCSSVFSFLLNHWRIEEQNSYTVTIEQTHMLDLAEEIIKGYHSSGVDILLETICLWSRETQEYAYIYFYPSLPQNIRDRYKMDDY